MGDRGNIAILQEKNEQIWFYGHWSGYDREYAVRRALAKGWRWNDYAYLARIIWDEFCPRKCHGEELSFGISTRIGDNEYPVCVVDCPGQRVFLIEETQLENGKVPPNYSPDLSFTFEEYINRDDLKREDKNQATA